MNNDLKEKELRERLFEIKLQLALLHAKDRNPAYAQRLINLKEELILVKRDLVKHKLNIDEEREVKIYDKC